MRKMLRKNNKGFTLVELIIVIAILAVLAVVAVPVANGIINDAKDSVDTSNIALFDLAVEMSAAQAGGAYPTDGAGVGAAIKKYTNLTAMPTPRTGAFLYNTTTHKVSIGTADETNVAITMS